MFYIVIKKEISVIRPTGYSNNTVFKSTAVQPQPRKHETVPVETPTAQPEKSGRKHLGYWKSLGISSLFGASAMGFATLFAQKWRTAAGFGAIIAGMMMLFDLPDSLYIGRK